MLCVKMMLSPECKDLKINFNLFLPSEHGIAGHSNHGSSHCTVCNLLPLSIGMGSCMHDVHASQSLCSCASVSVCPCVTFHLCVCVSVSAFVCLCV